MRIGIIFQPFDVVTGSMSGTSRPETINKVIKAANGGGELL